MGNSILKIFYITAFSLLITGCNPSSFNLNHKDASESFIFDFLNKKNSVHKTETKQFITPSKTIPQRYKINGKVEKGPFIENGIISITELDNSLKKTNKIHYTKIDNKNGEFAYEGSFYKSKVLIEANGKYFNEVKDKITSQSIHLKAIVDIAKNQKTSLNINALTSLQTERVKKLTQTGKFSFQGAKEIAKKEVLNVFGLDTSKIQSSLEETSLSNNPELLRISSILQGKEDDISKIQQLIDDIEQEISKNGKLENKQLIQKLQNNEKDIKDNVKYDKVIDNLKKKYPDFKKESKADPQKLKKSQVDPAGGSTAAGGSKSTKPHQPTDQEKINQFTDDDIKQWDNLNPNQNILPSAVSDPNFNVPNSHKGLKNFTVEIVAGSIQKIDSTGTYQYQAKVSNTDNSAFTTFTIQYHGLKTTSSLLNQFKDDDIKRWDKLSVNNTKLPSSIGNPDFSTGIPNNYKGLSNFTVEVVPGSIQKIDSNGTYLYQAKVTLSDKSASRDITVTYTGFLTKANDIETILIANDIKQWDKLNPNQNTLPSSIGNPDFSGCP